MIFTGHRGYNPSLPKVGAGDPSFVFAGENAIREPYFWRVFGGWEDMEQTRPLVNPAYTISLTAGSKVGVCSGGATCKTDFRVGQHVVINRYLYLIEGIPADDRLQLSPAPEASAAGQTIYKVPVLSPLNQQKATLQAGNAIVYRNAAIFGVGDGPLYVEGAPFAPAFNASTALHVAYPLEAGGYASHPAGFSTAPAPTPVEGGAGTKNMPAGSYWLALVRKRAGFEGEGNPSERVAVTLTSAGKKIAVSLPAFATGEGQTAWRIAVTRIKERTEERSNLWLLPGDYTTQSATVEVEWFDDDLLEKVEFDNDPPPPALYCYTLGEHLCLASVGGMPTATSESTPGPEVAAAKWNNPEAFSPFLRTPTAQGENIIGVVLGQSVAFLMTPNTLQVQTQTGNRLAPFNISPEWEFGFEHQFNGAMLFDYFYGLTKKGLYRTLERSSSAPVDVFALPVAYDLSNVVSARGFLAPDIAGQQLVVFWSNARMGAGGKWQTLAWTYKPNQGGSGTWSTPLVLGDGATADFIVTSAANVGGQCYFTTSDGALYRWETGSQTFSGFLGSPFVMDNTAQQKIVQSAKLTGNGSGKLRCYTNLDVVGLRSGASVPAQRDLSGGDLGESVHHPEWKMNTNCRSFALRRDFTLPARAIIQDQLEVEYQQYGGARS